MFLIKIKFSNTTFLKEMLLSYKGLPLLFKLKHSILSIFLQMLIYRIYIHLSILFSLYIWE